MAEINHSLRSLHAARDPRSPIISQFSDPPKTQSPKSHNREFLHGTESFAMERGPRFKEYSALRERKLRMNRLEEQHAPYEKVVENWSVLTPWRKQVKFDSNFTTPPKRSKIPSVLTQSVPDFSSVLRKGNWRPTALPLVAERSATPPVGMSRSGRMYGKVGGGSKSTNSAEKRSDGLISRRSYANIDG